MAQFGDFEEMTDEDVQSWLEQFGHLGRLRGQRDSTGEAGSQVGRFIEAVRLAIKWIGQEPQLREAGTDGLQEGIADGHGLGHGPSVRGGRIGKLG